jgi:hypothetical protein
LFERALSNDVTRDSVSRRALLKSASAVTATAAVAGCTGGNGEETTTSDAAATEMATTRRDESDDGGGDDGGSAEGYSDSSFYGRRLVFPYPERLGGDIRQKIIVMTDRKDKRPDELEGVDRNAVGECNFGDEWPPDELNVWEAILVDAENQDKVAGFFGENPTVRAEQLVERNTVFVDEQSSDVPLGTPFVVSRTDTCPGEFVGVEAAKIPSIDIKTGPGVSTGNSTTT